MKIKHKFVVRDKIDFSARRRLLDSERIQVEFSFVYASRWPRKWYAGKLAKHQNDMLN